MSIAVRDEAPIKDLGKLIAELDRLHGLKNDLVLDGSHMSFNNGLLTINGSEVKLTEYGVTNRDGTYRLERRFIDSMAGRLKIPSKFLRTVHAERTPVFDQLANGMLNDITYKEADGQYVDGVWQEPVIHTYPGFQPNSMVRTYSPDEGDNPGIARAFLSDRFGIFDNKDVVNAFVQAMSNNGLTNDDIKIKSSSVTNDRLVIDVDLPGITQEAGELLKGYRSPFETSWGSVSEPIVSAGLYLTNSEVGTGALAVYPVVNILACSNGMVMTHKREGYRRHLGPQRDVGHVQTSHDYVVAHAKAVMLDMRDHIQAYLKPGYLAELVAELSKKAMTPLVDPKKSFDKVSQALAFSEVEEQEIMNHFMASGQSHLAAGVAQAITSYVQTPNGTSNPDRAHHLTVNAVKAMSLV